MELLPLPEYTQPLFRWKTERRDNTTTAKWDTSKRLPSVEMHRTRLRLSVFDYDEWSFDDLLGSFTLTHISQ